MINRMTTGQMHENWQGGQGRRGRGAQKNVGGADLIGIFNLDRFAAGRARTRVTSKRVRRAYHMTNHAAKSLIKNDYIHELEISLESIISVVSFNTLPSVCAG